MPDKSVAHPVDNFVFYIKNETTFLFQGVPERFVQSFEPSWEIVRVNTIVVFSSSIRIRGRGDNQVSTAVKVSQRLAAIFQDYHTMRISIK